MKNKQTKTLFVYFAFVSFLFLFSCSSEQIEKDSSNVDGIGLNGFKIASRQEADNDDKTTESEHFFKEGDQITIVGAAKENVSFHYVDASEAQDKSVMTWRADKDYSWVEHPGIVRVCIGKAQTVEAGNDFPDILFYEYDCKGVMPQGGMLSLIQHKIFKHSTALIRVAVNNWTGYTEPPVILNNLHKIILVNSDGSYTKSNIDLFSIALKKVSDSKVEGDANYNPDGNWNLIYEAQIPGAIFENGILKDTNIESSLYTLTVDGLSIFTYEPDETLIPTYFKQNSVNTFTLNYVKTKSSNGKQFNLIIK